MSGASAGRAALDSCNATTAAIFGTDPARTDGNPAQHIRGGTPQDGIEDPVVLVAISDTAGRIMKAKRTCAAGAGSI